MTDCHPGDRVILRSGASTRRAKRRRQCEAEELGPHGVGREQLQDPARSARAGNARGTRVLASVTTAEEARLADASGVDGLVVQGPRAGGHSATFGATRTPDTVLTRAFTGRPTRALRNGFIDRHQRTDLNAYPAVHHTSPVHSDRRRRRPATRTGCSCGRAPGGATPPPVRHRRSDHPPPRRRGLSAPNRLVPDAAGSANPVDGAPERHTRVREGRAEGRDARLCGQVRVSRATAARSRCAFAAGARALRPVRHEHPRKRDAHPRVGGRPRSALRSKDDQRGGCRSNDSMSMICFVIA
ncbi:nitronate monooxygenase [Microbacterium sp. M4A5_1d]